MNPVAKLGSSSFCIYETTFLNLKVKYADVEGTNMYHVKSFVDSYNAANEEPIMEFRRFLEYDEIPQYLRDFYEISRAGLDGAGSDHYMSYPSKGCGTSSNPNEIDHAGLNGVTYDLFDSNNRWNIPNVIVYCYSQLNNTKGYWVRAEILSRFAQRGNSRFAVMVDMLIASIAENRVEDKKVIIDSLTLQNNQLCKNIKKLTNRFVRNDESYQWAYSLTVKDTPNEDNIILRSQYLHQDKVKGKKSQEGHIYYVKNLPNGYVFRYCAFPNILDVIESYGGYSLNTQRSTFVIPRDQWNEYKREICFNIRMALKNTRQDLCWRSDLELDEDIE